MSDDLDDLLYQAWLDGELELTPEDVVGRTEHEREGEGLVPEVSFTTAPEVLTVEELAALLRVSEKTIYKAVDEKKLPARRLGTGIRISRDAIIAWLAEGTR